MRSAGVCGEDIELKCMHLHGRFDKQLRILYHAVMANIRSVANEAGVSIATVSRVLNNHASVGHDVRSKVVAAANRQGYAPSVGKRATAYLAFVYTGPSSFSSPYDAMLMAGISEAMDETEFDLAVLNPQRDKKPSESYSQFFLRKGVRGVIIRTTAGTRDVCHAIAAEGFPSIVIGSRFEQPGINYVYGDSLPTSKQAVEHLISLGHTRIGMALSLVEDSDHADRLEGYRQALAGAGIKPDPGLMYRVPAQRPDGSQLIKRILSGPSPPTALFITDPAIVIGTVNQSHRMGVKIPDELSIIGFDDGDDRNDVYPQLTAVCQDAAQLGNESFAALVQIIEAAGGDKVSVRQAVPTWLEVHDTTAPPPDIPVRILPDGTRIHQQEKKS
jgi:DNA-binding LacI/PurR family transcriptional regulator